MFALGNLIHMPDKFLFNIHQICRAMDKLIGNAMEASKNRSERRRCCAEKRSFAGAKRGSQAQEMPAQ